MTRISVDTPTFSAEICPKFFDLYASIYGTLLVHPVVGNSSHCNLQVLKGCGLIPCPWRLDLCLSQSKAFCTDTGSDSATGSCAETPFFSRGMLYPYMLMAADLTQAADHRNYLPHFSRHHWSFDNLHLAFTIFLLLHWIQLLQGLDLMHYI